MSYFDEYRVSIDSAGVRLTSSSLDAQSALEVVNDLESRGIGVQIEHKYDVHDLPRVDLITRQQLATRADARFSQDYPAASKLKTNATLYLGAGLAVVGAAIAYFRKPRRDKN